MRLERPIGWWLLLIPCWWGLCLGQIALGGGLPSLWFAALFLIGAIIMRGAGCTLNDIADRNFDGRVERTRLRPIPSGQVSVARPSPSWPRSAS
jgi:4-hydroxybenzoate polyprenyltransferase